MSLPPLFFPLFVAQEQKPESSPPWKHALHRQERQIKWSCLRDVQLIVTLVCGWGSSITVLLWLFTNNEGKACILMRSNVFIVSDAFAHRVYCKIILEYSDTDWCMKSIFSGSFICHLTKQQLGVPTLGCCCVCDRCGTGGYSVDRVGNCSGVVSEKLDYLQTVSFHVPLISKQCNVKKKSSGCKPAGNGCRVH